MNRYTIGAYKHSTTLIKGVQNHAFSAGIEMLINAAGGAVDPTFSSVARIQPELAFTSLSVKTLLAALGNLGAALSSDKFWLQKMADGGARAGAASHFQVTMATGMIIPTQISAPQHGPASMSCRVVATSADGAASPLVIATTGSLEVGGDTVDELYTMGPVTINGVELEGVNNIAIDFGIGLDIQYGSGHVYPTLVGIINRAPSISVSTFDVEKFATWSETGVAQGISDSTVQLLDQVAGGVRGVAPITCTIDEGHIRFTDITGGQGEKVGGAVIITPIYDGVADIMAWTGIA